MSILRICMTIAVAVFPSIVIAAPPSLTQLFPAGIGRGGAYRVQLEGTFDPWPVEIVVDRDGLEIEVTEEKGVVNITAKADAPSGVYYLRAVNAEGASTLRPIVVGTLANFTESEPNHEQGGWNEVNLPVTVNGKLASSADVDQFSVVLDKGQTFIAALQGNRILGSPMDAIIQVADERGFVIAQNDDERGYDPMVSFTAPHSGTFVVRLFAFPVKPNSSIAFSAQGSYIYRLTLTNQAYLQYTLPLGVSGEQREVELVGASLQGVKKILDTPMPKSAAGMLMFVGVAGESDIVDSGISQIVATVESSKETPQAISVPTSVSGVIEAPSDVDVFKLDAVKDEQYEISVESRKLGFAADAHLELFDPDGKSLTVKDDESRSEYDPGTITYKATVDGPIFVHVRDAFAHGGPRHVYRLTIQKSTPRYTLELAADTYTKKAAEALEIPVTVTRLAGEASKINVAIEGLPEGLTCAAVVSDPGNDSKAKVTLKIEGAIAFKGALSITGSAEGKEEKVIATHSLVGTHYRASLLYIVSLGE